MNKWIMLWMIVLVAVLLFLASMVYQSKEQVHALDQELQGLKHNYLKVNDQLVALKRQQTETGTTVSAPTAPQSGTLGSSTAHLRDQLGLVDVALQHDQPMFALSQLVQISASLEQYVLSDAMRQSLVSAINNDSVTIERYLTEVDRHNEVVQLQIEKINLALKKQIQHPNLELPTKQTRWLPWLDIKRDRDLGAPLLERTIILKEAQLRLQLLQYAVARQQQVLIVNESQEIMALLEPLPDAFAKQMIEQLKQLNQMQRIAKPKLSALALLGATS